MLEEPQFGKPSNHKFLQCEMCGIRYYQEESSVDYTCVDDTGLCCSCYEEERRNQPDLHKILEENG